MRVQGYSFFPAEKGDVEFDKPYAYDKSHYLLCNHKPVAGQEYQNVESLHYANMPMQYTAIFHDCKNVNLQMKKYNIFSYFCSKH